MNALSEQQEHALQNVGRFLVTRKEKIQTALPKHIRADHMIRVIMNTLRKSPKLMDCSVESLWEALIEASTYGFEVGGPVAQAYIVPYGKEATLVPGYRGLIDLTRRSGEVTNVACDVVKAGDTFEYSDDPLAPMLTHKHKAPLDAPATHAWAGYLLKTGGRVYCVMTKAEIEAHRNKHSPSWNKKDGPWNKHPDAMWLKTVLKRPIMQGLVPIASDYRDFATRDDEMDQIVAPSDGEITPDEEWTMFQNEVSERLGQAETITAVNEVVDELNSEYVGEKQAQVIFDIAQTRMAAIRSKRGQRAKPHGGDHVSS